MTIDIPTRPQHQPPTEDRRRGGPQLTFGRKISKQLLEVGGQPRANLLPPEIIVKRQQLKTRRSLRFGVVLVAIGTAVGCVGAFGVSSASVVTLASARQQQQQLVLEQAKYAEVSDLQLTIETIKAGQQVGSSTEVAWRDYLAKLQQTLPSGVTITSVKIESGTPMQLFPQSDAPLQGARVGAISFEASTKTLPDIPDWLRSMASLPGFVDATPGSVKSEGGGFTVQVLMHYNSEAYSMRFDPQHIADAEAAAAAAAEAEAKSNGIVKSMTAADADDSTADEGGEN